MGSKFLDAYASQGLTLSLTESPSHWVTQSHRWKPIYVSVSTPLSLFLIWTLSTLSLHYLYTHLHHLCTIFADIKFLFFVKTKMSTKQMLPKRYFTKRNFGQQNLCRKRNSSKKYFPFLYWGPRDFGFKIMFDLKKKNFAFQSLMILYQIYLFIWKF